MQLHSLTRPTNTIPLEPFLQAADILVRCDEPLRALALLDNLPGALREHEPEEVSALRTTIHQRISTIGQPASDGRIRTAQAGPAAQRCLNTPLGQLHVATIQVANERGREPHLIDVNCVDGWLPIGLQALGCRFSYLALGRQGIEPVREVMGARWSENLRADQPLLFSIGSAVQYVLDPQELVFMARGLPREPDYVVAASSNEVTGASSTPFRRYTARELRIWCERIFPRHAFHVEVGGGDVVLLGELSPGSR